MQTSPPATLVLVPTPAAPALLHKAVSLGPQDSLPGFGHLLKALTDLRDTLVIMEGVTEGGGKHWTEERHRAGVGRQAELCASPQPSPPPWPHQYSAAWTPLRPRLWILWNLHHMAYLALSPPPSFSSPGAGRWAALTLPRHQNCGCCRCLASGPAPSFRHLQVVW